MAPSSMLLGAPPQSVTLPLPATPPEATLSATQVISPVGVFLHHWPFPSQRGNLKGGSSLFHSSPDLLCLQPSGWPWRGWAPATVQGGPVWRSVLVLADPLPAGLGQLCHLPEPAAGFSSEHLGSQPAHSGQSGRREPVDPSSEQWEAWVNTHVTSRH